MKSISSSLSLLFFLSVSLLGDVYDHGVGIGGAVGIASGGFGPYVEYQIPYTRDKRVTLTAGGGISGLLVPAYSAGITHEFGTQRRMTLAAAFGTFFAETQDQYGTGGEHHYIHELSGPSFTIGFKSARENGKTIAVGGGAFFPVNKRFITIPVLPSFNFSFGWKSGFRQRNVDRPSSDKISFPAGKTSYRIPENLKFIRNLDPIHFVVTNPRYLLTTPTSKDTANLLHLALRAKIYERLSKYSLSNFRELPDVSTRKFTVGFNGISSVNNGTVESLPYSIREDCAVAGIRYLTVFYVYRTNNDPVIEKNETQRISFPVPVPLLGLGAAVGVITISVGIAFDNMELGCAIYDVDDNRRLYWTKTDKGSYSGPAELVDAIFEKMGMW